LKNSPALKTLFLALWRGSIDHAIPNARFSIELLHSTANASCSSTGSISRKSTATCVEPAVDSWLDCGIFNQAVARVRCPDCRHDFLIAFSCKLRSLCPDQAFGSVTATRSARFCGRGTQPQIESGREELREHYSRIEAGLPWSPACPARSIAGIGWLFDLLPRASRNRPVDPSGVAELHRCLTILDLGRGIVTSQEEALASLAQLLERHQLAYMVIGGLANAVWGEPRATLDIHGTRKPPEPELAD
jgi:hypothetical protein